VAETAIVALVPELESLIPAGAGGMPPHVTLLYPFAEDEAVDPLLRDAAGVFARFAPFEVSFAVVRRWPETLYLEPDPAGAFVELTEALVAAFPDYPPYAGAHDDIVPHLTVAHGDDSQFDELAERLRPSLPVRVRIERAWLMVDSPAGWHRHTPFPLNRR
jgi:2'-5' RNA ligase